MAKISPEKRAARRAQILDAAWKCFERKGLHPTTMDNIIEASGLSAGAVYGYFKNKDDLIISALMTSMTGVAEEIGPLLARRPPSPPNVLLRELTSAISSFTARDGFDLKRIALLGWSEAQHNAPLLTTMRPFYVAFRDQLKAVAMAWQRDGVIDATADPDDVSKALLATTMGFVAQSAVLGDVEPDAIGRGVSALAKAGK
ncbi:MAG: TetR/AcrR family transcriptional regulator [Hyphomicrobium sp.]|uniref:TetR/AcrR family transcriptional regulator n=1 Tax=Hyphomicrobium sp. TaxID=82 RepID=UPI0039E59262